MTQRRDFLVCTTAGALALAAGCVARTTTGAQAAPPRATTATSALFAAIRGGDLGAIAAAIERQPELIDAHDEAGRSTLTAALLSGHGDAAQLVRELGYVPDLIESAWVGAWARVDELAAADPAGLHAEHPLARSAMHAAVRGGHGSDIWHVYAAGGLPNVPGHDGSLRSPLRAALELSDLATAERTAATLLSNAADPNAPEPEGRTSLHVAAARGSLELVSMLVRKGASVTARTAEGEQPLDLAARGSHRRVVDRLATHTEIARDHVSLRRAFDMHGRPCRPAALDDVDVPVQEKLVSRGHGRGEHDLEWMRDQLDAEPRLVHCAATTSEIAVEAATHAGSKEMAKLLLRRGAPLTMPTAVLLGDVGAVAAALDANPDRIHERGPHDFALLWYPVIGGGSVPMAKLLIQRGADVEAQSFLGATALHFAVLGGQLPMVEFLLEHGADVNRVSRKFDAAGVTPLRLAIERERPEIAKLLEARGARSI